MGVVQKFAIVLCAATLLVPLVGVAQDAVPSEILQRTVFIKVGSTTGTAFSVDYQGRMYLITARHVVASLPTQNAVIQVWQKGQWEDFHTIRTIFPTSSKVDIAIFETGQSIPKPFAVTMTTTGGPTMGQQVWFLGYPSDIWIHDTWSHFRGGETAPFIKRGTMSAIDATDPNAIVIYIDGFNNPGFSGGPIVYWDFSKHTYQILGVVEGYKPDAAKIELNGHPVDTNIMENSGILVAYDIKHVLDAIAASQKHAGAAN